VNCERCGELIVEGDKFTTIYVKPKPSAVGRAVPVHEVCPLDRQIEVEVLEPTDDPDEPAGYGESKRVWGYPEDE